MPAGKNSDTPMGESERASLGRRPLRLLIAALLLVTFVAVYVRYRFESEKSGPPVPLIVRVRAQLRIGPILAAEEALSTHPEDTQTRLRLADACAQSGDPVGAALALYPLLAPASGAAELLDGRTGDSSTSWPRPATPDTAVLTRFVIYSAQVGWLEDAAEGLRLLPPGPSRSRAATATADGESPTPTRARLELAAAFTAHGEAPRAVALLGSLGKAGTETLGAGEWLDGAMTWYQCRRPDEASRWAARGVAAGGGPAARLVLARCLLAAGRPDEALAALPDALPDGSADSLDYWRGRAGLRSRDAARQAAAREQLAHLGQRDPPHPVAAFEAGRAYLLAGQAAPAVPLLSRSAQLQYQEVLAYDLLARAFTSLGRTPEAAWARGRAQSARGQFREARVSLQRSLDLDPSRPAVFLDLARVLSLTGRPREALAVLESAQGRQPESVEIALGKADALNQLDRFPDQARELESTAARAPARAHEALRSLGRMYYETRQFDRAIPVLERAAALNDGDAEVHRYLGLGYALHPEDPAQAEKALIHLFRAAAIDPDNSFQWTHAGALLQRMGHMPEATTCYRRAIAWGPWEQGPYFSLAQALQRQGRAAEPRLLLRLYRERRDLAARRRQLENRIAANRGDAAAHFAMGDLLLQYESYRNAYPYLLIAASLRPRWHQAQSRLADACALLDYVDLWRQDD